jgi:hypothetical protein
MKLGIGIGLKFGRRGGAAGPTGLLDRYTGAAAAFSLDTLIYSAHSVVDTKTSSETYNDPAAPYTVLVRRDTTPNAWRSFTHTEVGDGTLTTWVGAGNNGFVEVWYNQGSAGDAVQTTTANQPKIVDNGSLVVENGKAIIRRTSADNTMLTTFMINDYSNLTFFNVGINNTSFTRLCLYSSENGGSTITYLGEDSSTSTSIISRINITSSRINSVAFTPTTRDDVHTGLSNYFLLSFLGDTPTFQTNSLSFGYSPGNTLGYGMLDLQSVIIYTSDQSANRTAIETALNNYYQIYP